MKKQNVKINFIFQILYQIIMLVIPLITAPYLTRKLGSENLGLYSFSYSIAYYFVLFASLGIVKHGQRIIASRRDNEIELRKTFWSLYFIHSIFSIISIIAYFITVLFIKENHKIYLIQGIFVFSSLFDVTWLYYGLENFKSVVTKNLLVKLLSTLLIFLLINDENDILAYSLIMCGSIALGHLLLIPQTIKNIKPIRFSINYCIEHIKPLFVLSIAVVAVTLYTVFDKTLIGVFVNKDNVAFYEYSDRIVRIPLTIISVIGTVLYPRACLCYSNDDFDGMKKYFRYSLVFSYFIGFGSIFGLLAISDLFVYLYYGEMFVECSDMIKTMTPLILIISLGDLVRTQFLIPMKKDYLYTLILLINASINIVISLILLPIIGTYGAIIGTIAAESMGFVLEFYFCRKYIDFKSVFICCIPAVISSIIMYFSIFTIKIFANSSIAHLIIQVLIGSFVYLIFYLIFMRLFLKDVWNLMIVYLKRILKITTRK